MVMSTSLAMQNVGFFLYTCDLPFCFQRLFFSPLIDIVTIMAVYDGNIEK